MAVALPSDGSSACHFKDTKERLLRQVWKNARSRQAKASPWGSQGEVQQGIIIFFYKPSNGHCLF